LDTVLEEEILDTGCDGFDVMRARYGEDSMASSAQIARSTLASSDFRRGVMEFIHVWAMSFLRFA
jgi:hypothetical protein